MDVGKIAGYVGALIAIGFGVALIWFPPANLAGQAGTVGAAFTFVTGGLATVGVTVTLPVVRAAALAEGERRAMRAGTSSGVPPQPGRRVG